MSLMRFPGGKAKLRDALTYRLLKIAREEYREPFFGGGGIGLKFLETFGAPRKAWINDRDTGLACLWTSIIRFPQEFQAKIQEFKPSVQAFHDIRAELLTFDSMPIAKSQIVGFGFKKLAIHQISYSGLGTKSGGPLGGEQQKSQYKIDCRWSPDYICKKVDKIHRLFASLSMHNKECTNYDFSELIKSPGNATLFLDPPYYVKGNDLYQCGFSDRDHQRLSDLLRSTEHNWLLTYDDCDEIRSLYDWAGVESLNVNYSITATKNKDTGERLSRTKPELLIGKRKNVTRETA